MAGHFTEFGLLPELCKGIDESGWKLPTDIQAEAIPAILGGGDVCLAAETGSGKTGAFCLPVVQVVQELLFSVISMNNSGDIKKPTSKTFSFKMNSSDRDSQLNLSDDGLICSSTIQSKWQGCRGFTGIFQGSAYYEATIENDGICRIGWSTRQATLELGKDFFGFGFGGTGMKSFGAKFERYGTSFSTGDIVGCELDLEKNTISFSVNGLNYGVAFRIPPDISKDEFYPAVVLKNAQLKLNFGTQPFNFGSKIIGLAQCNTKFLCTADNVSSFKFSNVKSPSALIIEPSRELANQTYQNTLMFCKYLNEPKPKVSLLIGGGNPTAQTKELESGVDIVVCTPAKFFDFLSKGRILLKEIRFFILDEADACLDMDMNRIEDLWKQCPKLSADGKPMQTIICSATLHNPLVNRFSGNFIPHAIWIDLKGQDSVPETVHHVVCHVDPTSDKIWEQHKNSIPNDTVHSLNVRSTADNSQDEYKSLGIKILKLLYTANAIRVHKMEQVIVFCRTRLDCDNMKKYFTSLGGGSEVQGNHQFSCRCLHSDMSADERNKSIIDFKKNHYRIMICTAVAARGLDIRGVPYVICVTIPDDKATYVHIIGRVGRAERMGLAITFVGSYQEKVWYHKCRNNSCRNTNLNEQGGCCRWHNDLNFLSDIESYLVETVEKVGTDFSVPVNEFDGVVTYGRKKKENQVAKLTEHGLKVQAKLEDLSKLEKQVQLNFLNIHEKICQRIQ